MALPSAVTVLGVTVVVAAGIGLAAAATSAADKPAADQRVSRPADHSTHHQRKASPSRHRHAAAAPSPRTHHGAATPTRVPDVLVGVYNNSSVSGLAGVKAAILEGAGWKVAATDNWHGDIPASTVYYPQGLRKDARLLAAVLHIERLRPTVAPMPFDRLTVILTSS